MENAEKFQLTRSRGARPAAEKSTETAQNFNSRAHVERDYLRAGTTPTAQAFQLTRSRGARLTELSSAVIASTFQLTRSRGARQKPPQNGAKHCVFQLTRSRGARQYMLSATIRWGKISTHALTWSATRIKNAGLNGYKISTHALTWSATRVCG